MRKKALFFIILLIITIVGINLSQSNSVVGISLMNLEALAKQEQSNEWESNYEYCRCKKDDAGGKSCYAGNAVSIRPACGKSSISGGIDCRNNDTQCRD